MRRTTHRRLPPFIKQPHTSIYLRGNLSTELSYRYQTLQYIFTSIYFHSIISFQEISVKKAFKMPSRFQEIQLTLGNFRGKRNKIRSFLAFKELEETRD